MKQTIRVGDYLSGKLHDEISADLKGYVTIDVKNKKTGEIEHQENHNLIVYGGREWLLRRMFGSAISNNNYAQNSGIKWVGFGCGGGEAGNPLQAGTTFGHDTDLYEPCRIRFADDSVTDSINSNYASRILPNGSVIPGYYKKISNITIKEDHANPYIENNIRKFPKIIAELRIELSSDECNGENYTENGNLVSYQDINEVALFISDTTIADPGARDDHDQLYLDVVRGDISQDNVYTNKTYWTSNISNILSPVDNNSNAWTTTITDENSYILYYRNNDDSNWIAINDNLQSISLVNGDTFRIERDTESKILSYKKNGIAIKIDGWDQVVDIDKVVFKLVSVGKFKLEYKNALVNTNNRSVECELQYRNYSSEVWRTIDSYTFTDGSDDKSIHSVEVVCNNPNNPDIDVITNFRVKQTINVTSAIKIKAIERDETSYNLKCFVSKQDIKKIAEGNFVYTDPDTESTNSISKSTPLTVIEVFDPEVDKTQTADQYQPYFVIERQESTTHSYSGDGLTAYTYVPSKASPYTMFSRVCTSSIRKTQDREIVLVWRIYC